MSSKLIPTRMPTSLTCFIRTFPLLVFFSVTFVSTVLLFASRGELFIAYFHTDSFDSAMDFFNCLGAASSDNPYSSGSNYPPMCHMLFKALHYFIPPDIPDASQVEGTTGSTAGFFLRNYEFAFIVYMTSFSICTAIILCSVCHIARDCAPVKRYSLAILTIASGPFLFLLERGNILVFALAGTFVYLACYDSESVVLRIVAYLSIAFATSIKIYPFVFSLLLLGDKRYRAFSIVLTATALMYLLPFAYYGGIPAINGFLFGISSFTSAHAALGLGLQFSMRNVLKAISAIFGFSFGQIESTAVLVALSVACLIRILLRVSFWRRVLAAGLMCVFIPAVSYTYALTFLLPALVIGIAGANTPEGGEGAVDGTPSLGDAALLSILTLSVCVILLPLVPLEGNAPEVVKYPLYWGGLIICFLNCFMLILLVIDDVALMAASRANSSKDG